jgi:hypothetical protein
MTEAEKLRGKFDSLRGRFGTLIANIEENRRFYNRDFKGDVVPERWQNALTPIIPQTARRAIDEPSDHILAFPHIRVPVRPTEKNEASEQIIAEIKRHAANAWWDTVSRTFNIIGDGKKPFLNEGKIAVRKTLRWDLIADYPERGSMSTRAFNNAVKRYRSEINNLGRSEFLWDVQLLDNITVYEDPANHRDPRYVFLRYRIFREEACNTWDDYGDEHGDDAPYDEVQYMEYWSKPGPVQSDGTWEPGKFIQWVEDEVVHEAENPYPYIPIVIEDAGFGMTHILAKPEERFVGMTQHAHEMFIAQAETMTSWHAINRMSAFPIGIARNMDENKPLPLGPGAIIHFDGAVGDPQGEDLVWLQHPDVPQGVLAMTEKIDKEANSTFKTDTLGGVAQRGVDTATEADLNVRNAGAKMSGPISGLERLVVRLTKQVFMDIELVLRAPITLYGTGKSSNTPAEVTIGPRDIRGFYEVFAELRTSEMDAIQQSKARFWLEAARVSPALSHSTALENGEIADDPLTEMIRRAGEDVFLGERFRMAREEAAAQALGMELAQDEDAGGGVPAPASDEGILGPLADAGMAGGDVMNEAMMARDANLGAAQVRGG